MQPVATVAFFLIKPDTITGAGNQYGTQSFIVSDQLQGTQQHSQRERLRSLGQARPVRQALVLRPVRQVRGVYPERPDPVVSELWTS